MTKFQSPGDFIRCGHKFSLNRNQIDEHSFHPWCGIGKWIWLAVVLVVSQAATATGDEIDKPAGDATASIDRGLSFLAEDAVAWRDEHKCASCHHAALVVWALHEAKQRGHVVNDSVLAELTKWVAESGNGKTGVPRPMGIPKALNAKAVWFSLALGAIPKLDETGEKGLKLMLQTVEGDQLESGAWASWPDTRPPIFGNSDHSMTALATLALVPLAASGDDAAKVARDKGVQWLVATKSDDDPQSLAIRLLLWTRLGRPAEEWQPLIQRIKERQNLDGGWSQAKEMSSDAWATGQALYSLANAGVKPDDPVISRARDFLIKTQRADGSWLMSSRPTKPNAEVTPGKVAITGAGSAWGVLGLVRSR